MLRLLLFICMFFTAIIISLGQVSTKEIIVKNNTIVLSGTLTYVKAQTPLVIWVHGSGNIDRNGNQAPLILANYIKQIRNKINENSIAFFSYDKRTANTTNKKHLKETLYEDLVSDVKKVVSYFKQENKFSSIILLGHSQGALTAMLASENTNKYISLAGASINIDQIILKQTSQNNPGFTEPVKQYFKELKETGEIKKINPLLMNIFSKEKQPFLKSWMKFNPSEEIKKVDIPTLIISGTKDLQISVEEAKALHNAKPEAKLVIIKNMNHVLKHVEKEEDNMKSYFSPDFTVSEELIQSIVTFIKE